MKDKINYLKEKYTFPLCILIAVVYLIGLKGVKWGAAFAITSNGYVLQLIAECVGVIVSVIIMYLVGKIYILREKGVGMSEEFIFRGTILNLFIDKFDKTKKGIYASIVASSIIFGIAHITNIFSGVSVKSSFIQAVGAAVLGALLSAIYLRTRNIWVVVILHAFMDFSSLIGSGLFGTNSLANEINNYSYIKFIGYLIYLVPVLVLLRKKKLLEILENKGLDKYHNHKGVPY